MCMRFWVALWLLSFQVPFGLWTMAQPHHHQERPDLHLARELISSLHGPAIQCSVPLPATPSDTWLVHEGREPHLNPPVCMDFLPLAPVSKGKTKKVHTNQRGFRCAVRPFCEPAMLQIELQEKVLNSGDSSVHPYKRAESTIDWGPGHANRFAGRDAHQPFFGERKTDKEKSHEGIWWSECPESVINLGRPRETRDVWAHFMWKFEFKRDRRDIWRDRWDVFMGQMGHKILYVYWFFLSPFLGDDEARPLTVEPHCISLAVENAHGGLARVHPL